MMATMRADEVQTEIFGEWVDDSVGWYNAKIVALNRVLEDQEIVAI